MRKIKFVLLLALLCFISAQEKIMFKSTDGLDITADLYMISEDYSTPFIVLFHQAGWSRGEYLEIAPKLNALGFNCMAVDQRSGNIVNNIKNETAERAIEQEKEVNYIDALPDLYASIEYVKNNYAKGKLILWGSSYSSALILHIASEHPEIADGLLSFAPGEYFAKQGKTADWLTSSADKIKMNVFITSAKVEEPMWKAIYDRIQSEKEYFLPETNGNHGSRALWEQFDDSKDYWEAVKKYLNKLK